MEPVNENKVRKVLFNEISFIIAVIGAVIASFIFLTDPAKSNTFALKMQEERLAEQRTTIDELTKTLQNDTKEVKGEVAGLRSEIHQIALTIERLDTIIQERIPNPKQ